MVNLPVTLLSYYQTSFYITPFLYLTHTLLIKCFLFKLKTSFHQLFKTYNEYQADQASIMELSYKLLLLRYLECMCQEVEHETEFFFRILVYQSRMKLPFFLIPEISYILLDFISIKIVKNGEVKKYQLLIWFLKSFNFLMNFVDFVIWCTFFQNIQIFQNILQQDLYILYFTPTQTLKIDKTYKTNLIFTDHVLIWTNPQ